MKRVEWKARIDRIRELRATGMTHAAIAKELGMYRQHVWKICREHGLNPPRTSRRLRPAVMVPIDPRRAAAITEYKKRFWGMAS